MVLAGNSGFGLCACRLAPGNARQNNCGATGHLVFPGRLRRQSGALDNHFVMALTGSFLGLSRRFLLSACLLLGLVLVTAFAPFSWYWLAIPVLGFVLAAWHQATPGRAALAGYCFGLGYMGGSSYWIYYSLHDYGEATSFVALSATALFVAILAVFFAVLAMVVALARKKNIGAFLTLLLWPSVWVLCEWLRTASFTDFPWNLLGQAMIDSPFLGLFPLLGVYGVSWLTVFLASLLVFVCSNAFVSAPQRRSGFLRWAGAVCMVVMVIVGALYSSEIRWTTPLPEPIRVAIVQANISQDDKFKPEHYRGIVDRYLRMTKSANADLVVWPESALPRIYGDLQNSFFQPLAKELLSRETVLISGVFARDSESGRFQNSLVAFGDEPLLYHKRHLVPFGEYMPWRGLLNIFSALVRIPLSDMLPGTALGLFSVGGHNVGVSICYEAAFADEMREASLQASYLLNVSNDSWFGDSSAPFQHLQIARLRAAEAQLPMVRATSTGVSAIIAHDGRVIRQAPLFSEQLLSGDLQPRSGTTLFVRWGSLPLLVASFLVMLLAFFLPFCRSACARSRSAE